MDDSFGSNDADSEEPRLSVVIPGTLIEDLKLTITEDRCIVFINLRYGNRFSLHIDKKASIENFHRFRELVSGFRIRVANIHKDVNLA